MTHKDYQVIASALNDAHNAFSPRPARRSGAVAVYLQGVYVSINQIADAFVKNNPNFDRQRFLAAATKPRELL